MHKASFSALALIGASFIGISSGYGQFADSIWTGIAKITLPALSVVADGEIQKAPSTTTNVTFQVPVEVWFWDDSTFLVVLDQAKTGANPERAPLQPLIGEWIIPVGRRVGALTGISHVPYGGNLFEEQTGKLTYSSRTKSGTFKALQKDTYQQPGQNDGNYIAPGALQTLSGRFRLLNSSSISLTGVLVTSPNPIGPNGLKYQGRAPSFQMSMRKTSRKPSVEGVADLDD